MSRYDVQDLLNGTPLDSRDGTVERVLAALLEAEDRGYRQGYDVGYEECGLDAAVVANG